MLLNILEVYEVKIYLSFYQIEQQVFVVNFISHQKYFVHCVALTTGTFRLAKILLVQFGE